MNTIDATKKIRERIRRNPALTVRKLGADLGVAKTTVHRIIKKDLGMRAFKKKEGR